MINRDSSSADTGTDAFAIKRSAAAISSGLSVSRRGGLNAQLRSARRITAGSGIPRVFLTRTGVTAVRPSTSETRPLAASFGHFSSMYAQASVYHVTAETSRTMESGRPESRGGPAPGRPERAAWAPVTGRPRRTAHRATSPGPAPNGRHGVAPLLSVSQEPELAVAACLRDPTQALEVVSDLRDQAAVRW